MVDNEVIDEYYIKNEGIYLNIAKRKYSELVNINEKDKVSIIKRVANDFLIIIFLYGLLTGLTFILINFIGEQVIINTTAYAIIYVIGVIIIVYLLVKVVEDYILHCIALVLKDIESKRGEENVLEKKEE